MEKRSNPRAKAAERGPIQVPMAEEVQLHDICSKAIGNSLFNIVTDGKHPITPTDAIRTILSAGMKLSLESCQGIGASRELFLAEAIQMNGNRITESGARLDKTLSALVKKLLTGERLIERTDWSVTSEDSIFGSEAKLHVSWVGVDVTAASGGRAAIDALIGSAMRSFTKQHPDGPLFVVLAHYEDKIGIGCTSVPLMPAVGAVLKRRVRYTAEEAEKLMALELPKNFESIPERKPIGVLITTNPGRDFSFSSSGAGDPDKVGKISWEIRNDEDENALVDSFAPLHSEPDDLYSVLKYRFLSAGTYRVRMIIRYDYGGEVVRDTIVDVE